MKTPPNGDRAPLTRAIGARARTWRARRGYTQSEAAAAYGVTQTTLSHYETGKNELPLATALAAAAALDISLGELLPLPQDELILLRESRLGLVVQLLQERPELLESVEDALAHLSAHVQPNSHAAQPTRGA